MDLEYRAVVAIGSTRVDGEARRKGKGGTNGLPVGVELVVADVRAFFEVEG